MFFASGPTSAIPETRRLRLEVFLVNMWLPEALRRRTLPVGLTRNRLAAPRCVFIFGMLALPLSFSVAHGRGLRRLLRY